MNGSLLCADRSPAKINVKGMTSSWATRRMKAADRLVPITVTFGLWGMEAASAVLVVEQPPERGRLT